MLLLMIVNIIKKNHKIELCVLFIILIKFSINLLDFEDVRSTMNLTQNIYYYAENSFALLCF